MEGAGDVTAQGGVIRPRDADDLDIVAVGGGFDSQGVADGDQVVGFTVEDQGGGVPLAYRLDDAGLARVEVGGAAGDCR